MAAIACTTSDLSLEPLIHELILLLNDNSMHCDDKCKHAVEKIRSYFAIEQKSKQELDLGFSLLFRPHDSLLCFIERAVENKRLRGSVKEALGWIYSLLNSKDCKELSQYIVSIKDACYRCLFAYNASADVKVKAYEIIIGIVQSKVTLLSGADLNINGLVTYIHTQQLPIARSLQDSVLGKAYELYGAIAENYPASCERKIPSLLNSVLAELHIQMITKKDMRAQIICGCMYALKGILVHFTQGYDEEPETSKKIYELVKTAAAFPDVHRKIAYRAALEVFSAHIAQFWKWVLADYKTFWLPQLSLWERSNNRDNSKVGILATNAFHRQAWKHLSEHSDEPVDQALLKDLLRQYKESFTNPTASTSEMQLALGGFAALASFSSRLMREGDDSVDVIFRVILQRAQTESVGEDDSSENLFLYLDSLSTICRGLVNVSSDQLAALERLAQLVVKNFPNHKKDYMIVNVVKKTLLNLSLCGEGHVLGRFLFPVVYYSVTQTCSQTLQEEAELQREVTKKDIVTYKSFLPLWHGIFGVSYESKLVQGVTSEKRKYIVELLHESLIKALTTILEKLDVSYNKPDSEETEIRSDPESCFKGTKPQDHSILCNVANLYGDLFKFMDENSLVKWLPELITTVINQSVRVPLVSAFYKLLAAILHVAEHTKFFQDETEETQSLGCYVVRYLEDVMVDCKQYKNDLQVSCLLAIAAVPVPLIQPLLVGIPQVIQMIFQLGQNFLSLAHKGISALEKWNAQLSAEQMKPILLHTLPSFDPYLRSQGILTDNKEDEELQLSKRQQQRQKLVMEASNLRKLQVRMLKLLSTLESSVCLSLLKQDNAAALAWTSDPIISLKMPFPDQRPDVYLDTLLPRVVELALTSSDRHTKTAACEVLHACIILFTGHGDALRGTLVRTMTSLWRKLMPALLKLSCGSDLVAKQLFHLLVMQLMHWFSSKHMLCTAETEAVVEAVWDGVNDEHDAALRDFSALCLKEFVAWSIRQCNDEWLSRNPHNIKAVIRLIKTYCVHPSLSKRIGAALVFNHMAGLLREETSLVERFWVELLYNLVRNLSLPGHSHNHPASLSLDHILKVMIRNPHLFIKESRVRRVPAALGSGQLQDVVRWLLVQCGSKGPACAHKCRQMVEALACHIPGLSGVRELVEGDDDIVRVCEGGGGNHSLPIQPTLADGEHLLASLDCYIWSLKRGLISPMSVIRTPSRLVPCLEYFLNVLQLGAQPTAFCSREDTTHTKTKCEIIVALLELLGLLDSTITQLPYTFWNQRFWSFLALCVFSPNALGLDWRNHDLSEDLPKKLRIMLRTLREEWTKKESLANLQDWFDELSKLAVHDCNATVDRLASMCQGLELVGIQDFFYVKGLETLHQSGLLQHVRHGQSWSSNLLLRGVFNSVFDSSGVPLHPEKAVINFASQLLSFAALLEVDVQVTLDCILNKDIVTDPLSRSNVTRGRHFLDMFKGKLVPLLLKHPEKVMSGLMKEPTEFTLDVILMLLNASKYSLTKFNKSTETLINVIVTEWTRLAAWAGTITSKKAQLLELLKAMVLTFPQPTDAGCLAQETRYSCLPTWLFNEIKNKDVRIEFKADFIDLLPFVVVHGKTDYELEMMLNDFQQQHFPVSCSELRQGTVERSSFIANFKAILRTLVATGSIVLLRFISKAASDNQHACDELIGTALKEFMKKHSKERQQLALEEIWNQFMEDKNEPDTRLGLVERFLIPMVCVASKPAVTQFYAGIIQKVVDILEEKLRLHDQDRKRKQQLVRKIGALQLVESLFSQLEKTDLEDPTNPVVQIIKLPKDSILRKHFALILLRLRSLEECKIESLQNLFCKMHCCSYKALASIMCNTDQPEEACANCLFKPNIWSRMVPARVKYTFPIEFDDYPKMKKQLVQIRSLVKASNPQVAEASAIYLPSQSLFNSSLEEDFTRYDFSMYNVRDENRMNEILRDIQNPSSVGLDLEEDCLNNHECMATLCGLVNHMCEKFGVQQMDNQVPKPPQWMVYLKSSLGAGDLHNNGRAFIMRLILNCQSYFKPFAAFWLSPILQCVIDKCLGETVNYLIHDIVRMLYDWHTTAIPNKNDQEKFLGSEFLRFLVLHTPNERKGVFRYNLEVVKSVVTMWKSCVTVPYQELLDFMVLGPSFDVEAGLRIADVFLAHNILPFNDTGKSSYYEHLLTNLEKLDRKVLSTCAAVVGKVLKIVGEKGSHALFGADQEFFTKLLDLLSQKYTEKKIERFIECTHQIQISYPPVVKRFVAQFIDKVRLWTSSFQVSLLENLLTALDFEFRFEAFSMLHSDLPNIIGNNCNPAVQVAALKFVKKLMPSLTPGKMNELLPSVISLQTSNSATCRAVVYDIVSWIYDNYKDLNEDCAQDQLQKARTVLIAGLADPDSQLQTTIYKFWTINNRLSADICSRLVDILRLLYTPSCEPMFLPTIVGLLLQTCEETNEFTQNIFNLALSECEFQAYNVSGSWRTRHAAFVPMFADTLASQISSASFGSFGDMPQQLRATQTTSSLYSSSLLVSVSNNNEEEMSLYNYASTSTSSSLWGRSMKQGAGFGTEFLTPVDETDGDQTQKPFLKPLRFLKNKQKLGRECADRNIVKGKRQEKLLAERSQKREGNVKLTRNYRKGDFPDIQIPYSGFINSLQNLAKRDTLIARQLLVSIYKALIKEDDTIPGLSAAVDNILQTSTQVDPSLMATLMEMSLLRPDHCQISSQVITDVCKNSHQMSLGALLVETKLSEEIGVAPPAKRARGRTHSVNYNDWMYLAEIYHSMEEKDVVQGLFEDKIAEACAKSVRKALQCEEEGQWVKARKLYEKSINESQEDSSVNFLYEATFKCYAYLSEWGNLNTVLKTNLLKDKLDDVWSDDWCRDHLLPWLFLSEIHCAVKNSRPINNQLATDFDSALSVWMSHSDRADHIKSRLGEYWTAVLVLKGDIARSNLMCENNLQEFLSRWQQLDTLSSHLRAHHLQGLQSLIDVHQFLSLLWPSVTDNATIVTDFLMKWSKTMPSAADDLVAWQTRAVYRHIFAAKMTNETSVSKIKMKLSHFRVETQMKTMECALLQRNFHTSRKCLQWLKKQAVKLVSEDVSDLNYSRVYLIEAQQVADAGPEKLKKALDAGDTLSRLREKDQANGLDASLALSLNLHTAELYSTLVSVVQKSPSIADSLSEDVQQKLDAHLGDKDRDVCSQLKEKVVSSLERATGLAQGERLAECYLQLARFCHQQDETAFEGKLIESLLRAMKHGSAEARRLFPCLLQLPLHNHKELFITESGQVPEWMFLSWVSQLLASLDTEIGSVLAPLLIQLATAYPVALQFPFQLSCEMYKYNYDATKVTVKKLETLLVQDKTTQNLVQALGHVCSAHHLLNYHIDKLKSSLLQGVDAYSKAYAQMEFEVYPPGENETMKGRALNDVKSFTKQLVEMHRDFLKNRNVEEYIWKLSELKPQVIVHFKTKESRERREKRIELADYSPWLLEGYEGEVEVPGQYSGESKPLPQHHLTIAGFKRQVQILQSLRAPIKITILGNDARDHPFLVKFEEDLRQDQRIQQLFVLMNHLLRGNINTCRRRLSVDTYTVVPLSSRLGLIEWIDQTAVLGTFIFRDKQVEEKLDRAKKIYAEHFPGLPEHVTFYNTVKRKQSIAMYRKAVDELPKFLLRDAVVRLSASPEAFVHLRSEMLRSHACLSTCQWLLGIGDRHLGNTLVRLDSGRFLGIDFGHAFGTATHRIPIPELIPMRLTPQILNLAAPLHQTGLLKETMVHTLRVLRDNQRLLLATMTVFVLEPSLDWLKAAQKHPLYSTSSGSDWYPKEKIVAARRKLEGVHPRKITEQELEIGHADQPHYTKLLELLRDEIGFPELRNMPESGLSARQQVECLIAQATNEHILSKTYGGWQPYV